MSGAQARPGRTKVAFVIWSLGLGGAEQVVIRLASALDRERFEPIICCLNELGQFAPQAQAAGVEVVAFHKRGPVDLRMLRAMAAFFRDRGIQVVHTHLWGAQVWGRIAARMAGATCIVATEHNVDVWKRAYHLAIDRLLAPITHHLVAVSREVEAFYETRGVGRSRWQVIYNGIDTSLPPVRERCRAYEELGIPGGCTVIGIIGRLVPAKAPDVFLEAMAIVAREWTQSRFLVVGDGPLRESTAARAAELGIAEQTIFAGVRQDVPQLLRGMDVLVFSSTREGLSIAMLEAMAAGVPVVATRVGGNPELIDSEESGFLVPVGDARALAERVLDLLRDPALAARVRAAARTRVERDFSLAAMVQAHEALFRPAGTPP